MNDYDVGIMVEMRSKTLTFNRKKQVQDLSLPDIMYYLSVAQQYLNDEYHLYEINTTIDLVADQSVYVVGINAYNLPKNLQIIKSAELNGNNLQLPNGNKLTKTSKEFMDNQYKLAGLPSH